MPAQRLETGRTVAANGGETSQTLDRGLTVLSLLASRPDGLTVAELADGLSTARAIVYRLLRTLEAHNLVSRIGARYVLGFGIAELAGRLRPRLQATVLPLLRRLSEETSSTALLSIADGDQALILMAQEPPFSTFHIALREGARHPLTIGADGIAILAGRPATEDDSDEVRSARRCGYAVTIGALQEGAVGVAAPVHLSDWAAASIGIVQLGLKVSNERIPAAVMRAAAEAGARLSGSAGAAELTAATPKADS
jgi:DNA-binding IclR family transcriptional regulator